LREFEPLPVLLAGPIVRRAEPERVCIWVATSRAASLRAVIMRRDGTKLGEGTSAPGSRAGAAPVPLGERLFVHLLEVRPRQDAFPQDEILLYDLWLDGRGLGDLGLLDGATSLAYGELGRPSLVLSSRIRSLLHGSCRKPHGATPRADGAPIDQLVVADPLLRDAAADPRARPAALFLTGDQIYADDVAAPLLAALRDVAKRLTGGPESLPGGPADPAALPLYGRKPLVEAAGLSSARSHDHLLTFGEYAAMYLFAFGGLDLELPEWEAVADAIAAPGEDWARTRDRARDRYLEQKQAVERFAQTLPAVRRVLANLPTYMIFDDHEVSDDWNLNRRWQDAVVTNPLGRRLVANALAAYWAFQGWGNDPDGTSPRLIETIAGRLRARCDTGPAADRFDVRLLNRRGWGYVVPSDPPVIVLDTRTQREFDSARGAAQLLDRYALGWLRIVWADLLDRSKAEEPPPAIVVSPAPVYGFELAERMQKFMLAFGKTPTDVDLECWVANRAGFGAFMRVLACELSPPWVLFLSGDVHYSFSTRAEFEASGRTLRCWQATSSPLCNDTALTGVLHRLSRTRERYERRFGWEDPDQLPGYWRPLRPAIDLAVRVGWPPVKSARRRVWTDRLEGIAPEDGRLVQDVDNLGRICFGPDLRPLRHELRSADGSTVTFELECAAASAPVARAPGDDTPASPALGSPPGSRQGT